MALISIQLRLDVVLHVDLVNLEEAVDCALVFGLAVAVVSLSFKRAIVAGASSESVEPFCAVGLRASPFANDEPFVGSLDAGDGGAGCLDVLAGLHGDLIVGKDLVDVGV